MNREKSQYSKEFLIELYRTLYKIRVFETKGIALYRQGHIRGYYHPYLGEEAIATGACAALDKDQDYIVSTHRGHGHCIAWSNRLEGMFAELMGKATGCCKGMGGSMHIADLSRGNMGANAIVGASIPLGAGAALGVKIRGEHSVVVAFTSDGAANCGPFAEGLNMASVWKLPLIVMIENNQFAVDTPIEESSGEVELFKRGQGYGVNSIRIDGNQVLDVYEATRNAVALCRDGKGPYLVEAMTYRHSGHHVNDPGLYMPKEKLEHYQAHDPIVRGRKALAEIGGASEMEIKAIETSVEQEMEEAIAFAKSSPELTREQFFELVTQY